ncbi:thioredoxin family protein [Lederbergia sp. NSJ-179]|uniref:thioredoxin family protein n=1 Tax=Lederbergia sp. NSJ-179 TaxID=2931402 RepID=UPI001FD26159|nr:thioredoxin family protein [Lederbergia sp. NSJ-179]MCJ7840982.1 thioredoxin family protein [Lederbergia sp. NSJ-179]
MNLSQWFQKGIPANEYIQSMKHHQENTNYIREHFTVPTEDTEFFPTLKQEKLRVIAITEDWCGDAMLNIPILLNLAEKADMEVRMLLRDQNLELMDQYLTNGTSRAIPIFIFIDQAGNERAVWGPRAASIQQFVEEERSKLPEKEDPKFEEQQKDMYEKMTNRYVNDPSVWDAVYESIKLTLQ